MGRMACCEKVGLKKGPWSPEEDEKLVVYIKKHGHGNWRSVPTKAGLQRCGKSCRLRSINYLRPDIKRGEFSLEEDRTIIHFHALIGNKWSIIASHLPMRTDNEIKNYWNTNIKKRLIRMGIDPNTHKPKTNTLEDYGHEQSKDANMNHLAQWESARLEAEARESMFQVRSSSFHLPRLIISKIPTQPQCPLDPISTKHNNIMNNMHALMLATNHDLQSSVSSSSFTSKKLLVPTNVRQSTNNENSILCKNDGNVTETSSQTDHKIMDDHASNLQDDDIMTVVEAFRTRRCDSIQELFNGP